MNKKILDILEFDKVKQLFEPYLQTEQGEMELAALTPTDKKESIETAFMELEDMGQILRVDHGKFFSGEMAGAGVIVAGDHGRAVVRRLFADQNGSTSHN